MGQKANTVLIDADYGTGQHHKLAGLSEIERCRYLAIWSLATELGREMLPEVYSFDDLRALGRRIGATSTSVKLHMTLKKLIQVRLILRVSDRIVVVGLADRLKSRTIDRYDGSARIGSDRSGSDRIGSVRASTENDNVDKSPDKPPKANPRSDKARFRALWFSRSLSAEEYRKLGERFLVWCQSRDRNPRKNVDCACKDGDNPYAVLTAIMKGDWNVDDPGNWNEWLAEEVAPAARRGGKVEIVGDVLGPTTGG